MLEDYLASHADKQGDRVAIACGNSSISYRELYRRAQERATDVPFTMRASNTIDFLVNYFAAHIAHRPFVPLDKDIADERFSEITELVGSANIPHDVADILFTSGTTGKPKGVMISNEAIVASGDNLVEAQGYSADLAFVVSGPLSHVGSLSKVWSTIMVGGTIVLTDGVKDMASFLDALDYPSPKIATFLVPASIRMLLQFAPDRLASYANKIDFVETGASPMTLQDMQGLCSTLPLSRLYNTYASTETGIIATHNYNVPGGMLPGCLGRPMKHSSIAIGDSGRIVCGGKTLMTGYIGDNLSSNDFATNDIGSIDSQGRLFLDGRIDDIINVGGFKVSPLEVENAAMLFPSIADCICVECAHPIVGSVLKLKYSVAPASTIDKSALVSHLKKRLESYKVPLAYEQVDTIVRNANGKLDRKHYRQCHIS